MQQCRASSTPSLPCFRSDPRTATVICSLTAFPSRPWEECHRSSRKGRCGPWNTLAKHRIAPHKLGLVALHRARLLMGETRRSEKLRIFISHAKFDGIFLALSIKSAIEQISELSAWYDAEDIEGGSAWQTAIEDAASACVLIAVRTNTYELRKVCRNEFMYALLNGVPIVVVDALMQPVSDSCPLPFS